MSSKQRHARRARAPSPPGWTIAPGATGAPLVDTTNDPIIQNRRPKALGQLSAQRELLRRRAADLARGRRDHPPRHRQQARDRRFRARLLRRARRRLGQSALHPRRRHRDAQRGPSLRLGELPAATASTQSPARAARRVHAVSGYRTALRRRAQRRRQGDCAKGGRAAPTSAIRSGCRRDKEGKLDSVLWGSPAFDAALRIGRQIVAVGERAYSEDALKDAVTAAKGGNHADPPDGQARRHVARGASIHYHGGLRYPRLVKVGKGEGPLDLLLKPR